MLFCCPRCSRCLKARMCCLKRTARSFRCIWEGVVESDDSIFCVWVLQGRRVPSREALRERAAAVVEAALQRLLDHGRRGKLGPLWDAALGEADRRLLSLETSPGEF